MPWFTEPEKGAYDMQLQEQRAEPLAKCNNCRYSELIALGRYKCKRVLKNEHSAIYASMKVMDGEACFRWRGL